MAANQLEKHRQNKNKEKRDSNKGKKKRERETIQENSHPKPLIQKLKL